MVDIKTGICFHLTVAIMAKTIEAAPLRPAKETFPLVQAGIWAKVPVWRKQQPEV